MAGARGVVVAAPSVSVILTLALGIRGASLTKGARDHGDSW